MKTKLPKPKISRQIVDEASAWFVDFREGDVDQESRERFDEWLRRSPEHIRAYMEIAKTYVALPTLDPGRKVDVALLIECARAEGNIVSLGREGASSQPAGAAMRDEARREAQRVRGPWRRMRFIAAASLVLCLAAGLLSWSVFHRYPTYTTDIGERRSITLADGSTIDLNARSKVRIRYSAAERGVELVEGQALFEVTKDASRPFVVRSGTTLVRAVGTQFDVYRKQSGTTVTVLEGRVAVAQDDSAGSSLPVAPRSSKPPPAAPTFVSAGEQVTVSDHTVATPRQANLAAATAWIEHRLIFDGTRLSDVVDDFNRYNTRQIVIEDRELQDFHVSGVYSSTDPASLIRFLREQPGVRVIETDNGVRITRQ